MLLTCRLKCISNRFNNNLLREAPRHFQKPNCLSLKSFPLSKNAIILDTKHFLITLENTGSNNIGLYFDGFMSLPFLKLGITVACLKTGGMHPASKQRFISLVRRPTTFFMVLISDRLRPK